MTGKELRRIRLQLGLTQESMGKMVGVDSNTVSRYERGRTRISPTLAILARHLAAGCRMNLSRKG